MLVSKCETGLLTACGHSCLSIVITFDSVLCHRVGNSFPAAVCRQVCPLCCPAVLRVQRHALFLRLSRFALRLTPQRYRQFLRPQPVLIVCVIPDFRHIDRSPGSTLICDFKLIMVFILAHSGNFRGVISHSILCYTVDDHNLFLPFCPVFGKIYPLVGPVISFFQLDDAVNDISIHVFLRVSICAIRNRISIRVQVNRHRGGT